MGVMESLHVLLWCRGGRRRSVDIGGIGNVTVISVTIETVFIKYFVMFNYVPKMLSFKVQGLSLTIFKCNRNQKNNCGDQSY